MKRSVRRVLGLAICLVLSVCGMHVGVSSARAADTGTWTQLPSYRADVYFLAVSPIAPTTLYAGTMGDGFFRSTNGGTSWTSMNTGLTDIDVLRLAIDPITPSTLYAGTFGGGVCRSTNGGDNWTGVNAGLADQNVTALAIDPLTPATLYVGTDGGGVYRSTNGGALWTKASNGLTNMKVYCLAVDPLTPSTIYAATYGGGACRSIDSGTTWTAVNSGLTSRYVSSLVIDVATPATLYAGTYGGGVCRSMNGGTTWTVVGTGLTSQDVRSLVIHPTTPTTLYAGTYGGGVCRSTNGGTTWTALNAGLTNMNVRPVAVEPVTPFTLYAGTEGAGVFRYEAASSYVLKTAALPAAGGTVRRTPDAASYIPGTVVTLTAVPAVGYPFTGWAGDLAGSANPATIVMDADKSVTARFALAPTITSYDLGGVYTAGVAQEFHTTMSNPANGIRYDNVALQFRIASASPEDVSQLAIWFGSWQSVPLSADGSDLTGVCHGDGWFLDPGTAPGDTWHVTFNTAGSYSVTITLLDHANGDALLAVLSATAEVATASDSDHPTITSSDLGGAYVAGIAREFHITMSNPANGVRYDSLAFKFRIASASAKDASQLAVWNGSWENVPLSPDGPDLTGICASIGGGNWNLNPGATYEDLWHVTFRTARPYAITVTFVDHANGDAPLSTLSANLIAASSFTLTPTAGTGGTITPNTPQTVLPGGTGAFAISPNSGYRIADVTVDGVSQGAISSYSFTNVTSNHTISAKFEKGKKQTVIVLQIGNSTFTVNGASKRLDSPPIIKNGRTLVPIRAVIEALGGTVGWDGTARKATVALGGTTIELWIGKGAAKVNGVATAIDATNAKVVPEIISSRTMLPLRFVSENLGCSVVWTDATKTITITYAP